MRRFLLRPLTIAATLLVVLSAAQARQVRVATYNVLDGVGTPVNADYNAVKAVLQRINADVVAFQELPGGMNVTNWLTLASELGYTNTALSGLGPFSGGLYVGYYSRFPILSTFNVQSPPSAAELTRSPLRAVIAVPDAASALVIWTMHHKCCTSAGNEQFRRAIEAIRIVQDIDAYVATNPAQTEFLFLGDLNQNLTEAQPAQYDSLPSGLPASYVLGSDITFPVLYATFPTDRYSSAGGGMKQLVLYQEDTTNPATFPPSSVLDYIFVSHALTNTAVGEIYNSEQDDGAGGLPKAGAPLPTGTSGAASDHFALFTDINMADAVVPTFEVTPSSAFGSTGNPGGPFAPSNQTYTVSNTNATDSVSWSVTKNATWLDVSATNGVLAAGDSTNITVSINAAADSLAPGSYAETIRFNDTVGGAFISRSVNLTISAPPVASFTGNPTAGAVPLTVTFADSSTGTITNRLWDFGDGSTTNTTATTMQKIYGVAGTNTVSLTVSGPGGDNTQTRTNYIVVLAATTVLFDSFDPDINLANWAGFGSTVLATNYGGSVSAPNSLWFGGSGSRFAVTRPLDTTAGGQIDFYLRLAGPGGSNPWENVEVPAEGVVLEYSANGGANWIEMGRYDTIAYRSWTFVSLSIPAGAQGPSVQIRWRQLSNSGSSFDHWALDNVSIAAVVLPPAASFTGSPTTGVAPLSVTFTNSSTGTITNQFWDFGDSQTTNTTAPTVQHTYDTAGTFTVTLIVSGPTGMATNTQPALINVAWLDSVGDGIPDWWRQQYFGSGTTTNDQSCATCDPDGDGLDNRQEYVFGSVPTDAGNVFQLQITPVAGDVQLSFPSLTGRQYTIEINDALGAGGSWLPVGAFTDVAGTGSVMNHTDSSPPATRAYRLRGRVP